MTDQEIIDLINASLAEEFELDPADMNSDANIYEDLGLDSLDTVDMVVVLEGAFKFKIREEDAIRDIRTLGDIHRFVIDKKRSLKG
ncbi:phosphopantetheine-binding protein [Geoalkalibacter halelectricus]|uniref:Acyl carrier protein n=1 Tax=Geoalkalibacter halelectricus TaxID=2847045 RepID=A0ABY5ZJC8_9BACT|nr:phosphopantetheine-binding protein [Geoalkalibacter halelectricus]MDO3379808.1 phosphopantetheine-binding protein [Geoalkalibacter halelectricus]UWZ79242.1 phosphopantetheine-binding protein [Geoalkalibacter halelectricus]